MTANMGDSNVVANVTGNIIDDMRGVAVMEDQSRRTEAAENAGGRNRTRAAAPCLLRMTTSGEIDDEKSVIKFDYDFDGGFQSKNAFTP